MEGVVSKILPPLKNNYVATSTAKVVTEKMYASIKIGGN